MKKFLAKTVAALLALLLAFSLAACTIGDQKDGAQTGGSDDHETGGSDDHTDGDDTDGDTDDDKDNNTDDNTDDNTDGDTDDGKTDDDNTDDDGKTDNDGFVMPEGGFDTSKDVTITFYHTMGSGLRSVLNEYIKDFQKMYPNITVEPVLKGSWDDLYNQISMGLLIGNHPNIAYCYADHVADYNVSNSVLPLNGFLAGGDLKDKTVPTVLVDQNGDYIDGNGNASDVPVTAELPFGLTAEEQAMYNPMFFHEGYCFGDGQKMYTLPWARTTEELFYNKSVFDENGWQPPKTWDEMETLCRAIKAKYPSVIPFGYDSESNWFITMCEQYGSPYTSAESPHFRFDNEQNRAFVQKFNEWYQKEYFTTSELGGGYTSSLFLEEKILMSIGSIASASYYSSYGYGSGPEVGVAPIPQVDPVRPKVIAQGPSVCLFKDDDPQKVIASWLFVKFMTTNVSFQAEFAMKGGYMPVLKMDTMAENPIYRAWLERTDGGAYLTALAIKVGMVQENNYFVSPAFVGSSAARDLVGKIMPQVFAGVKSLDEAFRDAIDELKYRYGE